MGKAGMDLGVVFDLKRKSVVYIAKNYHCTISIPRTIIYMHSTDTELYIVGGAIGHNLSLPHNEYERPYIQSRNNCGHGLYNPLERISP